MEQQLTVADLGELVPCQNCGKQTYLYSNLPDWTVSAGGASLPKGFTVGNRRKIVQVRGQRLTVCEICRYDVYGSW